MRARIVLAALVLFSILLAMTPSALGFSDIVLGSDELDEEYEYVEFSHFEKYDSETITGYMRMENTGTKIVDTSSGMYSTHIIKYEAFFNMTFDDGIQKGWANMSGRGVLYADETTGYIVKSAILMNQTFSGDMGSGSYETRTNSELLNYTNTWPGPNEPAIGDKWTVEIETLDIDEYWQNGVKTDEFEDTYTSVTYYEYVEDESITTMVGTFDCMVYKNYRDKTEATSHYTLDYIPKGGSIPLRSENYDEGKRISTLEVESQRVNGKEKGYPTIGWLGEEPIEPEKEDGMFGLGEFMGVDLFYIIIILSIVLLVIIIIIVILLLKIFKKKEKYDPNVIYTCRNCSSDLEYDRDMTEWFCGTCGEYTKQPGPKKDMSKEKYPGVKTGAVEEFYDEEDRKAKLAEQDEYFEYDEEEEKKTHYVEVPDEPPRRRRPPEERRRRPPEDRRRRPPEDDYRRERRPEGRRRRPPEDYDRPRRDDRRRRPPEDGHRRERRPEGRRRRPPEDDYRRDRRRSQRNPGVDWD